MVKSIHDLSEEEMVGLSKEIKELLKEYKKERKKDKASNNDLNSENFELSSWIMSTAGSKETEENLTQISENLSQKQSKGTKKLVDENKSLGTESLGNSETYNIEELIKDDETLKELKKLTSILEKDNSESVFNGNELPGSSASWTSTLKKEAENCRSSSIASTSVRETNPLDSDANKTVKKTLNSKVAKQHPTTDNISKRKQVDLKFDSSKTTKSIRTPSNKQTTLEDGFDIKSGKMSTVSIRTKKKNSNREGLKVSSDSPDVIKKKGYCEGTPEYIKRHYVPVIAEKPKHQVFEQRRRASSTVSGKFSPNQKKKTENSPLVEPKPEEDKPLFPLKIDCISMFSDDEEEVEEEALEEESSSSDPGDPEVMLKELWEELLLPSDESDMDLGEFYAQFPKLRKNVNETFEENTETCLDSFE